MVEPGPLPEPVDELTADDVHDLVRRLGLVPIPAHLVPKVLAHIRHYRASLRRLDEAGIDLADAVTAQPFRADERGGAR